MFKRESETYELDPSALKWIFADEANPLFQISRLVSSDEKVLDIGAGNGLLAKVLKEKYPNLIIDGIEPNPHAAKMAKKNYRAFFQGFVQDRLEKIKNEHYDVIVLADVIEHLSDPLEFLQDLTRTIGDETRIIISTPNVAFGAVRLSLLEGRFDYTDSGLLERTHLRFLTFSTLSKMVAGLDIHLDKVLHLQREFLKCEIQPIFYKIGYRNLKKLINDPLAHTYQFVLVLTKKGSGEVGREYYGKITQDPFGLSFPFLNRIVKPIRSLLRK